VTTGGMLTGSATRGGSAIARLPARTKVVALIVLAFAVVATPREWFGVYAGLAGLLFALAASARIRPGWLIRRLSLETPVVVFVVLMPIVATGPRMPIGPITLSIAGLWGSWALLAKATLALVAALVLIATTEPRRIVLAFEQLRLPKQLTLIMGFMLRYVDLIAEEFQRARVARASRGFEARGPAAWRLLAGSIATHFVRSHARGERIHLAMLARGHSPTGTP